MLEGKPTLDYLSDEEILFASRRRPALFRTLIDRYESAFRRRARRVLGASEEVDDAVVETFTKIYLKSGQFKKMAGASFRSWAYKILEHTTYTYYRKRQRFLAREISLSSLEGESLTVSSEVYGLKDLVARALALLPSPFARVLSRHFLEGAPLQLIASEAGESLAAVKVRLHRAKKEFRKLNLLAY